MKLLGLSLATTLLLCSAAAAQSTDGTTIPPASSIVDNSHNTWTVNGGIIYKNGSLAGKSANVAELLFRGGVIWQENKDNNWWYWSGSTWVAGTPGGSGVDGVCGSAAGKMTSSAPTSNLCSSGPASAVAGSGPWTWTCSGTGGGSAVSCLAPVVTKSTYPLPDGTAASQVQRNGFEPRPDNGKANATVPTTAQLQQIQSLSYFNTEGNGMLHAVTGNFPSGTTDEILQWAAIKWGFNPDIARADAVDESNWHQNTIGDIGHGVSLSILQVKSSVYLGTCPQSPNFPSSVNSSSGSSIQGYLATQPGCLSYNSTPFGADYRMMHLRACVNKDITYLANHAPVSGHANYSTATGNDLLWGCVGVWYSGYYWDSNSTAYISRIQGFYNSKPWLKSGF